MVQDKEDEESMGGKNKIIIVTGIKLDLLKKFGFGTFNLVATFKERAANQVNGDYFHLVQKATFVSYCTSFGDCL